MLIKTISNSANKRNIFNILFWLTSAFLRKYIEVIANERFTNESVVWLIEILKNILLYSRSLSAWFMSMNLLNIYIQVKKLYIGIKENKTARIIFLIFYIRIYVPS